MPATLSEILQSPRTGQPIVMGILNVTPDSFSDGGMFLDADSAVEHARRMVAEGADILDVGAESTRPGSPRIAASEQIARLEKVLPAICKLGVCVSVDTTLAPVARFALDCGVQILNDISAGQDDAGMLPLAAQRNAPIILMHMQGTPADMQREPTYANVLSEVRDFLAERVKAAELAGVPRGNCLLDPGIGFGKTLEHNLALLAGVPTLCELGLPVVIGVSRKGFIGTLTGQADPAQRVFGSVAAASAAYERGATIFRVHNVAATVQALKLVQAIRQAR